MDNSGYWLSFAFIYTEIRSPDPLICCCCCCC